MFVDIAKVTIFAGFGGDGVVAWRHEKYIDKGGPEGGDGGRGGDVIFVGSYSVNTLVDFRFQPRLEAKKGESGAKRNKHGKAGDPLRVKVPVGTIVKNEFGEILADIIQDGQEVIIARGGDGGYGNAHFKSSTRQAPRIAEKGEPGEAFDALLELKLLADVGLVGFPNAGKSTFLSVVSSARPEIADYAFTTLTPNLGVADIDNTSLLIADIPGLIEGASEGKGLGDAFLRHVERTSVLLHLIDAYTEDIAAAYKTIRAELEAYSPTLLERPEVVAITKSEGLDQEIIVDQLSKLQEVIDPKTPLFAISSPAHTNITELLRELRQQVESYRTQQREFSEEEVDPGMPVISLSVTDQQLAWHVRVTENHFIVKGNKIEKFSRRTDFSNPHGINRLRDIMKKMGITHELERKGANGDSIIKISGNSFTLREQ